MGGCRARCGHPRLPTNLLVAVPPPPQPLPEPKQAAQRQPGAPHRAGSHPRGAQPVRNLPAELSRPGEPGHECREMGRECSRTSDESSNMRARPRALHCSLCMPCPCRKPPAQPGCAAHARPPPQVSALTNLRVLYLHDTFHRRAAVAPGDWDALRQLRRLSFLSVSCNRLAHLPPPVLEMTHLRVSGRSRCCLCAAAMHACVHELSPANPDPCQTNLVVCNRVLRRAFTWRTTSWQGACPWRPTC